MYIHAQTSGEKNKLHQLLTPFAFIIYAGMIPAEIGNLISLTELKLGWNFLEGCKISSRVIIFDLYSYMNVLLGCIPTEIGKLIALVKLTLICNKLSGTT